MNSEMCKFKKQEKQIRFKVDEILALYLIVFSQAEVTLSH